MKNFFLIYLFIFSLIIFSNSQEKVNISDSKNTTEEEAPEFVDELPISEDEIDKILFCSVFFQEVLEVEAKKIEKIATNLKLNNSDQVYDKIGSDILEKCYNKTIDISTIKRYFVNGTYVEKVNPNDYKEFMEVSFEKYKEPEDIEFTDFQKILTLKLEKALDKYNEKKNSKIQEDNENIRIGTVDIQKIPISIKVGLLVLVFGLLFGGTIYFLKNMNKKPEKKKKKKN